MDKIKYFKDVETCEEIKNQIKELKNKEKEISKRYLDWFLNLLKEKDKEADYELPSYFSAEVKLAEQGKRPYLRFISDAGDYKIPIEHLLEENLDIEKFSVLFHNREKSKYNKEKYIEELKNMSKEQLIEKILRNTLF